VVCKNRANTLRATYLVTREALFEPSLEFHRRTPAGNHNRPQNCRLSAIMAHRGMVSLSVIVGSWRIDLLTRLM